MTAVTVQPQAAPEAPGQRALAQSRLQAVHTYRPCAPGLCNCAELISSSAMVPGPARTPAIQSGVLTGEPLAPCAPRAMGTRVLADDDNAGRLLSKALMGLRMGQHKALDRTAGRLPQQLGSKHVRVDDSFLIGSGLKVKAPMPKPSMPL